MRFGLKRCFYCDEGVMFEDIEAGSMAAASGLRPGDKITHIEGGRSKSLMILH
jgi:S1-C subfamily serine protease